MMEKIRVEEIEPIRLGGQVSFDQLLFSELANAPVYL